MCNDFSLALGNLRSNRNDGAGGAAEKTGALKAGDQLLEVNGYDVTRMSRIEAWSLMKKLHDGEVNLLVRHPATKSS